MKLALSLIFAGASHGIELPRLQKGVHIIKTTEDGKSKYKKKRLILVFGFSLGKSPTNETNQ